MESRKYDPSYVAKIAAADIKRFGLSASSFDHIMKHGWRRGGLSDDAVYYMTLEGSYSSFVLEPGQKAPDIPVDDRMLIGTKGHQCPHCFDDGEVRLEGVGTKTGLRIYMNSRCQCKQYNWYYRHWNNLALVPENYNKIKLRTLDQLKDDPRFANWSGKVHDDPKNPTGVKWAHAPFAELIETLKQYPDKNYLFCGRSGTGKTTCLLALYQHALWQAAQTGGGGGCEYIWKVNANQLSNEFHDWKTNRSQSDRPEGGRIVEQPTVTAGKIKTAKASGLTPRLFLEEIDKFNLGSDFQRNVFWSIFDELEPNNGQIVVTSNLNREMLSHKLGEQHGPAILRRIEGPPNGIYIDFSSAEITKSFDLPAGEKVAAADAELSKAAAVASGGVAPAAEVISETLPVKKPKLKVDKTGRRID